MNWEEFLLGLKELGLVAIDDGDGLYAVGNPKFANPMLFFNKVEEYKGSVTFKSINTPLFSAEQIKETLDLVDIYLRNQN